MTTSRTTRSSAFRTSNLSGVRAKRANSPEKKSRTHKKPRFGSFAAAAAYARSVATVARAVDELKYKLLDEAPSHKILDEFYDEVSGEVAFTFNLCTGPRWLVDAIARACEEILHQPVGHSTVYLTEIAEHGLIHGSVVVGDYTGAAVYFDDIHLGAVGLYPQRCATGSRFLRLVIVDEDDLRRSRAAPN
jgi:hypothetical protein